jgi:demethylmenaquinone methyltransferase/2-methoxy-6-polyprenyl-1,4-benzoquinol methylase
MVLAKKEDYAMAKTARAKTAGAKTARAKAAGSKTAAKAAGQPDSHFGFRQVPIEDKQTLVDDVFDSVARRYDLMNDLMSGGLHRAWKEALVTAVNPPKGDRPFALLDVAGGTGDIAFRVIESGGAGTQATVCDINAEMLGVGRERAMASGLEAQVSFVEGNAEALPFPDKSFDAYTIAFGIRNVPRIAAALAEAYRVLKPGSRFLCLEFSSVDVPGLDALYDFYSFNVIPALGRAVAGDGEAYRYLVESIRQFPKPQAFAELIAAAGFGRANFRVLTGGIVALHSGWRL